MYCQNTIHLLDMARSTMDIDHGTVITVGVIILFFYTDLFHVSNLYVWFIIIISMYFHKISCWGHVWCTVHMYVVCPESVQVMKCIPSRFQVRPCQLVSQTTQSQILTQVAGQEIIKIKVVITITSYKLCSCSALMLDSIYYLLATFWPACSILLMSDYSVRPRGSSWD